ncbi:lipopolysaccharide-induced tumor necrosis factor-alpha factor homolog [Planococcus citri]|uniref:lipopolysaccharide-induced tumor necrosis factor-alpha factor homolog n=1 Tax=Planococcus citri TaxID=170843 RepID=UPI0031F7A124
MKDIEHHQQQQQNHAYPPQMPSAPPTYDEVMYGTPGNPPYPSAAAYPTSASYPAPTYPSTAPYPTQPVLINPPIGANIVNPPTTVVEVQRTIIAALGPAPAHITCPHCRYVVVTSTETEPNCAAHLCCLFLLVIGCCPFSSLPYCMDSLKNVRHYCPNCKAFLGSYQP